MTDIKLLCNTLSQITIDSELTFTKQMFNDKYGHLAIPVLFDTAFRTLLDFSSTSTTDIRYFSTELRLLVGDESHHQPLPLNDLFDHRSNSTSTYSHYAVKKGQLNQMQTSIIFNDWHDSYTQSEENIAPLIVKNSHRDSLDPLQCNEMNRGRWFYVIEGFKIYFIYPRQYFSVIKGVTSSNFKTINELINGITSNLYKPAICIQRAGELLFIPGSYYYATAYIKATIEINRHFINEINYDDVRAFILGQGSREEIEYIDKVIANGFKNNIS